MKKENKSEVRLSLESKATRHATFETLLSANYSHFFDENNTRDFMRSHQFFFSRAYYNSIERELNRREVKPCGRLGTCCLCTFAYE